MLQFIDSADDVLALRISHKIRSDDLDSIMDRLEEKLAQPDTLHIFVETQVIDGIELSGLPAYMSRAMPLMGKLKRFGRVAVVADQAWVRFGTQLESLLLPFISYRTFKPEERDSALAWVERGERDS